MFRALIDGTYRHLFSVGLPILDEEVRYLVRKEFSDWQVKTKDQVTYDDLHQRLLNVRYQLDIKLDVLISKLFIRKIRQLLNMSWIALY